MKTKPLIFVAMLFLVSISEAEPEKPITDLAYSAELLLGTPLDEMRETETFSMDDLAEKDRGAVLTKLARFLKLTTLKFYSCDLSHVDEKDAVPAKVKAVLISGGKISQGTIKWLTKFPAGVQITVGGCDLRKLTLDFGKFSWVKIDNSQISESAVIKLIKATGHEVIFKEVTLSE